jgi:ABC-2 type transport system permease protein
MIYLVNLWMSLDKTGKMPAEKVGWLIVYQFLALGIARLTASHFDDWVIESIKDGSVGHNFLKPFSYRGFLLANEFTWRVSGFIYMIPTLLLLIPVWGLVSRVHLEINQIFFVLGILFLAFFQRFFVSYLITLTAYWFQEAKFMVHLKWMLEGLLGGAWIPVYFYPLWFQRVSSVSPFYFWYTIPINGLLSKISWQAQLQQLFLAFLWVIILWFVANKVEKAAMSKFSAVGG